MDRPSGVVAFTPDPSLYPFESRWFDSSVGPVHFVDEGEGRPVLLLHGNPDWSFIYRRIIAGLRDGFRCVAPDYPGFGLSVHPPDYGYTPAEHATVLAELVQHLDLTDMVVVGQDWGGPIGMDIASRHPGRVGGLVMGNTWFWPTTERMPRVFSRLMGSPPLQWLIRHRNLFVSPVMRRSLRVDITDEEFAHYAAVVPTPASREGIAVLPRQIIDAGPWLAELETRVGRTLRDVPVVLIFGRKDPALGSDEIIGRWREEFPAATYVDLPDAGHYIQEDAPDVIADAVRTAFG